MQEHHDEAHPEAAGCTRGFGHRRGGSKGGGAAAGHPGSRGHLLGGGRVTGALGGGVRWSKADERADLTGWGDWSTDVDVGGVDGYGDSAGSADTGAGAGRGTAPFVPGQNIPVPPPTDRARAAVRRRPLTEPKERPLNKYALPPIAAKSKMLQKGSGGAGALRLSSMRRPPKGSQWSPFNRCRCGDPGCDTARCWSPGGDRSYDNSDDDIEFDVEFDGEGEGRTHKPYMFG